MVQIKPGVVLFLTLLTHTPALAQCPPARPSSLSASQGTYCNRVFLSWPGVNGASSYAIYTSTTNDFNTAHWIGSTVATQFNHATGAPGVEYYYWVTATRAVCLPGSNTSSPSPPARGWRDHPPPYPMLAASKGSQCGGILLGWTADFAPGTFRSSEPTFKIYRNTVNIYLTSTEIASLGTGVRSYVDTSVDLNETYYYWVQATNQCGERESESDWGEMTQSGPAPLNDDCSNATAVVEGQYSGATDCASRDGSSTCGGLADAWYRFTARHDGTLRLSTCDSPTPPLSTVLSVHSGCPGTTANQLACNEDACSPWSRVSLSVETGRTYYIRVAGESVGDGDFTLTVTPPDAPCYPDCDPSGGPGVLDIFDFLCFQDAFVQMDPYADCDQNTAFDIFDFLCFQDAFASGCP